MLSGNGQSEQVCLQLMLAAVWPSSCLHLVAATEKSGMGSWQADLQDARLQCRKDLTSSLSQGSNVMEEQDLREIGISDPQHRRKLLQAARSLPKVTLPGQGCLLECLDQWFSTCGS